MIKQPVDYIKKQKRKYLIWSLVWIALVFIIFTAGIIVTDTRDNYFTLMGALLILPLSLNLTRFISFSRFKDGKEEFARVLEQMKGSYTLFHSGIIPDARTTILFEHIIITSRNVYFLSYHKDTLDKNKVWLENRLSSKDISPKNIHFVYVDKLTAVRNAVAKIEKDACYTSEALAKYTQIIQCMLM